MAALGTGTVSLIALFLRDQRAGFEGAGQTIEFLCNSKRANAGRVVLCSHEEWNSAARST